MTRYTRSKQDKYERLKAKGVKGAMALLVFDWLCCNTVSNIAGLYRIPFEVLYEDIQCGRREHENVKKALHHLAQCGVIRYHDKTQTVWVVGYIEHNIPSNNLSHNNVKGLIAALEYCRRLPFFDDLLREYPWLKPAFDDNTVPNSVPNTVTDTVPNSDDNTVPNNQSSINNHIYIPPPAVHSLEKSQPVYPPELIQAVKSVRDLKLDASDFVKQTFLATVDAVREKLHQHLGFTPEDIKENEEVRRVYLGE